jgi:uncharacterized protein
MPVNANPEYASAEKAYLEAQTIEEKIERLEQMLVVAPKHKSSENLLANLKTRLKKLLEQKEKQKKSGKSSREGIRKEDMQAVLIGKTNSGKSSILSILTNAKPSIKNTSFTTLIPTIGMASLEGTSVQLIENPAIDSDFYDKGLPHTADTLLIIVTSLKEIPEILKKVEKHPCKKIIVFNKIDLFSFEEKRKIQANLQSKKYNWVTISAKNEEGIKELKEKIFNSFDKMRIYTKEPGKEKSERPVIMNPEATVKDIAEKILKGFSQRIKETKIWGPSSKFSGQKVGLSHVLKDLDVVEFKTK